MEHCISHLLSEAIHRQLRQSTIQDQSKYSDRCDKPDLYRLLLVLSVDAWDAQDLAHDQDALHYYKTARELESSALEQVNIGTVQSRLLKVMYLQLSGKHGLVACEVGSAVRAAQCIGLHRQSRQFKLS